MWRILPLIIFILLAIFMWQGLKHDPHLLPSALINKPMPEFSLPVLPDTPSTVPNTHLGTDKRTFTRNDFLGHMSLLNIWATWCATCRQEHAVLMDIARSNQVVIVGLDYKDGAKAATQWLTELGNPYQVVAFDEKGKVGMELGVYGTPETYLIDAKGIIRYRHLGPLTPEVWEKTLLPLIHSFEAP